MSDIININLFTAGVVFLLAFLLWLFSKKIMQQKNIAETVFGAEKIFVNDDLLLEMFQFCNFRTVGTNFCMVNRRWSQIGQWHCQNRPHHIPRLILNVKEECYPRIAEQICWEKNAYLRSWHQDASEKKLANVPLKIPNNYEKIQNLRIEFPYDWNECSPDKQLMDFITACSAHMRSCAILIRWNDVEAPPFSYQHTMFKELFLASIAKLKEIHLMIESWNLEYSNRNPLYLWTYEWLLGRGIDDKNNTPRKLYLIGINILNVAWYINTAKKKFFETLRKMPIFDVSFLLERGEYTISFEAKRIKNTKTGQIFYTYYKQIDGVEWVSMRLCNSVEEADGPLRFTKTLKMPIIQWNIHPGKDYIQMREEMEKNKAKLNPGFVDLLK